MAFKESVGQLLINGEPSGTAWMIAPRFAVTAWHCVEEAESDAHITIRFGTSETKAATGPDDKELDVALLQILPGQNPPPPLPLTALPTDDRPTLPIWVGHGYPGEAPELEGGLAINGTIGLLCGDQYGSPRLILNCEQGINEPDFSDPVLGGVSGGPVLIPDQNCVVAVLVRAPDPFGEKIVLATPVSAVVSKFAEQLGELKLSSWNARLRLFAIYSKPNETGFLSNIDSDFIAAAWTDGLNGGSSNLQFRECANLRRALLRLILHADSPSEATLQFRGAESWEADCSKLCRRVLPVVSEDSEAIMREFVWRELSADPISAGGEHFSCLEDIAATIHHACDAWVLEKLRILMDRFLSSDSKRPVTLLGYTIEEGIRDVIDSVWTDWQSRLEDDRELLHHFLAMMLTAEGDQEAMHAIAGVGPRTVKPCLFPALVFSLAICACLPDRLSRPKPSQPGNLGEDDLAGHSCAVQLVGGERLQTSLRGHRWATPIVLLPQLGLPWIAVRAASTSFVDEHAGLSASLDREPERDLVITLDNRVLEAMGSGLDELRQSIVSCASDLGAAQQAYVQNSEAVLQ